MSQVTTVGKATGSAPTESLRQRPALGGKRSIRHNFLINVAGAIVPLGIALITVPIYIRHIGDARYGILSIVWVLLGYLGFLDLGLSRAAANALAQLRDAPREARARVVVTSLALNLGMGLIGAMLLAAVGNAVLQHMLNVPEQLKPEIASALPWIVGLFPLALLSGVGLGTLEATDDFLAANVLQVAGTALGQVIPVLAAILLGASLSYVVPAAAISRGVSVVAILVRVWAVEGPFAPGHFSLPTMKPLLRYGGWVSVSAIISPVLTCLDQFVIGSRLNVAAVAHYAVPMSLVLRSQIIPVALNRTLFPTLSKLPREEATPLARNAVIRLAYLYAFLLSPAIFVLRPFMMIWLGGSFVETSSTVGQILILGAWINGLAYIPGGLIQAQGRPDLTARFHLLELVPYTIGLLSFTMLMGLPGAAFAWVARVLGDTLLIFSFSGIVDRLLVKALLKPASLLALAFGVQIRLDPSPGLAIVLASASALLSGLLMLQADRALNLWAWEIVARIRKRTASMLERGT